MTVDSKIMSSRVTAALSAEEVTKVCDVAVSAGSTEKYSALIVTEKLESATSFRFKKMHKFTVKQMVAKTQFSDFEKAIKKAVGDTEAGMLTITPLISFITIVYHKRFTIIIPY